MSGFVFGRIPVLEALRADRVANKILVLSDAVNQGPMAEIIDLAHKKRIGVQRVKRDILDRMTSRQNHQGALAFVSAKSYCGVEDILGVAKEKNEPAFIILLDGIEDPHNLGAIIRTADACGAHGVIIPKHRAASLTDTVSKTSAGAVEYVNVARVPNINNIIRDLKEAGVWVVGIDASASKTIYEVDFKMPTALVIGSEGRGLADSVKRNCEVIANIPMKGEVSSLNASVAAAISMYEVVRQRGK